MFQALLWTLSNADLERLGGEHALEAHLREHGAQLHGDMLLQEVQAACGGFQVQQQQQEVISPRFDVAIAASVRLRNAMMGRVTIRQQNVGFRNNNNTYSDDVDDVAADLFRTTESKARLLAVALTSGLSTPAVDMQQEAWFDQFDQVTDVLSSVFGLAVSLSPPPVWSIPVRWLTRLLGFCAGIDDDDDDRDREFDEDPRQQYYQHPYQQQRLAHRPQYGGSNSGPQYPHPPRGPRLTGEPVLDDALHSLFLSSLSPLDQEQENILLNRLRFRLVRTLVEILRGLRLSLQRPPTTTTGGFDNAGYDDDGEVVVVADDSPVVGGGVLQVSAATQELICVPIFQLLVSTYKSTMTDLLSATRGIPAYDHESVLHSCARTVHAALEGIKTSLTHDLVPTVRRLSTDNSNFTANAIIVGNLLVSNVLGELARNIDTLLVLARRQHCSPYFSSLMYSSANLTLKAAIHFMEVDCVRAALAVEQLLRSQIQIILSMGWPSGLSPIPDAESSATEDNEYWFFSELENEDQEALVSTAISGMHNVLNIAPYRCDDEAKRLVPELMAAYEAIHTVINSASVAVLTKTLVCFYLPLRQSEVDDWEDDPEAFVEEELRGAWQYDVKAATLTLLSTFESDEYRHFCLPVLEDFANSLARRTQREQEPILLALSSSAIKDVLSFERFWSTTLVPLSASSTWPVLQVRVAQFVEGWAGEVFEEGFRDKEQLQPTAASVFAVLLNLLQSPDYVVSLWAAVAIRTLLLDFGFSKASFAPYVVSTCGALSSLLQRCSETATNIEVLRVVAMIIKRMRVQFGNYVAVFAHLNALRESAILNRQRMLLVGLMDCVETLVRVVDFSVWESFVDHFIVDVIRDACDTRSLSVTLLDDSAVLIEGGLKLWLTLLRRYSFDESPAAMPASVLDMFSMLPNSIYWGSDALRIDNESLVLSVLQQYVHASGPIFLFSNLDSICTTLVAASSEFSQLSTDGQVTAAMLANYIVQIHSDQALSTLEPALCQMLLYFLSENELRESSLFSVAFGDEQVSVHIAVLLTRWLQVNANWVYEIVAGLGVLLADWARDVVGRAGIVHGDHTSNLSLLVLRFLQTTRNLKHSSESSRVCAEGLAYLLLIADVEVWQFLPEIVAEVQRLSDLSESRSSREQDPDEEALVALLEQVSLQDDGSSSSMARKRSLVSSDPDNSSADALKALRFNYHSVRSMHQNAEFGTWLDLFVRQCPREVTSVLN